jgi:hypothetical protein
MDFSLADASSSFLPGEVPAAGRADSAWRALAVAAGHKDESLPSAEIVAGLLNRRANPELTPSDVLYHLNEVASSATGADAGENPARLSELLQRLKSNVVAASIASSKVQSHTKRILNQLLDVTEPAAMTVLALASAHAYGRPLSPEADGLLKKIARGVDGIPAESRAAAQRALRDLVKAMIEAWSGASMSLGGSGYDALFSEQQGPAPERERSGRLTLSPERILATSFEVGALGGAVWNAVGKLGATEEGVRQILDLVKRGPRDSNSVEVVAQQFATPTRLIMLLREDPIDRAAVGAIAARNPDGAASPLIDALIVAEKRDLRTWLLDQIATLGPSVCALASERLQTDDQWFVQRNMLRVIREAKCVIDPKVIDRFVQHSDVRVREEAVQIQLNDPVTRNRALAAALRDPELSMLKIGLKAARAAAPEGVMPFIAKRIQDPGFPRELRMASLHVLARSTSVLALEPLLRFALGGTTLLRKPKLAAKSPEMLVALDGLARMWPNERRAAALLALARESTDPEITKAAEGSGLAPAYEASAEPD